MGYNTAVLVLNDALGGIRDDQQFGEKLAKTIVSADAFGAPLDVSVGSYANYVRALPSEHADMTQVVLVGGNAIRCVAMSRSDDEDAVLRSWALERGYDLRKRKAHPTPL